MQIVRVRREQDGQVARLREVAALEVAETDDALWVRAAEGDESLDRLLAGLGGERFELLDGERLVPRQASVPTERLPPLNWTAIRSWAAITLPVAALSGQLDLTRGQLTEWSTARVPTGGCGCVPVAFDDRCTAEGGCAPSGASGLSARQPLRLIRGGDERPPTSLVAEWHRWFDYATTAPEVRLRPLAFALSADGRALICGSPLPPILGQFYIIDAGIATPCGWSLSPAVGSAVVRKVLDVAEDETALFTTDGSFERIGGEHFVRASRSAVRASGHRETHV